MAFGAVSPLYSGTMASALHISTTFGIYTTMTHLPDKAPTPRPATKRPTVICAIEWTVPV